MFSGLVEQVSPALELFAENHHLRLALKRPAAFRSLKEGDSFCVDGVCLTLEKYNSKKMFFSAGPETLKITGWTAAGLKSKMFNLERSLTLQSPIGGHFVTGHVDGLALAKNIKKRGDSRIIQIQIPPEFKCFFWRKAYIALNGVSLTVNHIKGRVLELCLIPKTLKSTNLSSVKTGDLLNFEVDYMSRPLAHGFSALVKKLSR